ncbi:glycerophosphodiester phosphodiesterase [Nocardioides salarius]|uniref:glycerophosphodiester phosphodiesterase n=1 Tax=Nocardioides salarius TaxID=374513 RepID=UPI0030F57699
MARQVGRRVGCALVALGVGAGVLLGPTPAPAGAVEPDAAAYAVVAHRGAPARGVTENTLPSLRRAVRTGADAVEIDVSLTSDERFVLMHDATLERTTTCRGPVAKRTLTWIRSHCRGVRGREPLPSLGTALGYLADTDLDLVLEIKRHPDAEWSAQALTRLAALVGRSDMGARTLLLCFHAPTLELAEETVPDLESQWVVTSWKKQVLQARRRPTEWVDGVNVWTAQLSRRRVRALRADGLLVLGRNTEDRRDWSRLRRYGVDGVMTDDVPGYLAWSRRS